MVTSTIRTHTHVMRVDRAQFTSHFAYACSFNLIVSGLNERTKKKPWEDVQCTLYTHQRLHNCIICYVFSLHISYRVQNIRNHVVHRCRRFLCVYKSEEEKENGKWIEIYLENKWNNDFNLEHNESIWTKYARCSVTTVIMRFKKNAQREKMGFWSYDIHAQCTHTTQSLATRYRWTVCVKHYYDIFTEFPC